MPLPRLLRKPLKWLYCAAVVVIGFAGHAYLSHWHEDWSDSLPHHQVERYVTLVRDGDSPTIEKLLALARHEHRSVRNTAVYLLDEGGALDRLDRATRVDYLVRRLGSPWEFAIYENDDPDSDTTDFDLRNHKQLLRKLWRYRDLVDPIVLRDATLPGQFEQVLRERWSMRWLYTVDRATCADVLMKHLSVAVAAYGGGGRTTGNQSRRSLELLYAVPMLAWMVAYTPHLSDDAASGEPRQILAQAGPLIEWWQSHASLTQQQREAEAIEALFQRGPPVGEQLLYAQWVLNRSLLKMNEARWGELFEKRVGWTRLAWASEGFQRSGFAVAAPWGAEDVESLLGILESASDGSAAPPGFLVSNALWLLEHLAADPPAPSSTQWIGPLVRFPFASEADWRTQFARWNEWWTSADRATALRDPAPIW